MSIGTWKICALTAAHSSTNTTTVSACIRRSAMFRPKPSSKQPSQSAGPAARMSFVRHEEI